MKKTLTTLIQTCLFFIMPWISASANQKIILQDKFLIQGNAPSIASDGLMVYMVFAKGDSIQFCSSENPGNTFSGITTIGIISRLSTGGGRGPKIVLAGNNLLVAAPDASGNIHTFLKDKLSNVWQKGSQINDVNEVVPEGFISLSSNSKGNIYAVWLDTRGNKKNKIVGAASLDGGKTWTKNKLIYESTDGTVCECCKPTVIMDNLKVVVMFRNFLLGNRDMFIIQSSNGGKDFGEANKVGTGSWQLNACPMDGGGVIFGERGKIETVWRREGNIYKCQVGSKEEFVSSGKQCVISGKDGKNFIAFVIEDTVYCMLPDKKIIELGKGSRPELTSMDNASVFCAWENKGKLNFQLLKL